MAAAECGRDVTYFTFGDKDLEKQLNEMYEFLCTRGATVGMSTNKHKFTTQQTEAEFV